MAETNRTEAMAATAAAPAPALSVVIPVHNEAGNILVLLGEVRTALDGRLDYEVVVVDDCSTDETPRLLTNEAIQFFNLRVLRHARNSGQSTAVMTGVHAARAAWVVTLDGDGQNDPADIPNLWSRLQQAGPTANLKLIAGQRVKRQDSRIKLLSSRIANRVRGALLGDQTPDTGCGIKLFNRATFLNLPHFDHMHRFLPALVLRSGGNIVSVAVNHRPRLRGESHYGMGNRLWVGIVDMLGVMWLQRRNRLPGKVDELTERH